MSPSSLPWSQLLGNERYRGGRFGWIFLLLVGGLNLFRGSVHLFTEDGGASRIAGIDLSQGGEVILSLFAIMGLNQLLMAAIDLSVAVRFRALVPVVVAYHGLHQLGAALIIWVHRPLPVPAPGKYGALVILPVVAIALWSALRQPTENPAAPPVAVEP